METKNKNKYWKIKGIKGFLILLIAIALPCSNIPNLDLAHAEDEYYRPSYVTSYRPTYVTSNNYGVLGFDVNNFKQQTRIIPNPVNTWETAHWSRGSVPKKQEAIIPNPINTWVEYKNIDTGLKIAKGYLDILRIGGMIVWPPTTPPYFSAVGFGARIGEIFSPHNSPQRKTFSTIKDISGIGGLITSINDGSRFGYNSIRFFSGKALSEVSNPIKFNPNISITHSATIPLNNSWNDDFNKGYIKGEINVIKTFTPDPLLSRTNTFPWGTYRESTTLTKPITIIETRGINDINSFQRQWNIDTYKLHNYTPVYTPPPPVYIPPLIRPYTPPAPPVYTPPPTSYNNYRWK